MAPGSWLVVSVARALPLRGAQIQIDFEGQLLSLGELQSVLQLSLHERVSIRDLPTILETFLETAPGKKNPVHLVEGVRQALGRSLVTPLLGTDRKPRVPTLGHAMEDELSLNIET